MLVLEYGLIEHEVKVDGMSIITSGFMCIQVNELDPKRPFIYRVVSVGVCCQVCFNRNLRRLGMTRDEQKETKK